MRAHARWRVEAGDADAARSQSLGQSALWIELDLQLAAEKLLFENGVLAHIRGDHLLDLASFQQIAEAEVVHASVVGHRSDALDAFDDERLDEVLGDAAQAKATYE